MSVIPASSAWEAAKAWIVGSIDEAPASCVVVGLHQAQRRQPVEVVEQRSPADHLGRRLDRPAATEHRKAVKDVPCLVVEQAIAGSQGAAQRTVHGGPGALQVVHVERIGADRVEHATGPEHSPTARGQLQRQRQPVETATHLGDHHSSVAGQLERWRGAADAVDEQLDRGHRPELLDAVLVARRYRQRPDRPRLLVG